MRQTRNTSITTALTFLVKAFPLVAEETPGEEKLVLVLSGGGARGIAHIGVLRVLEEMDIAPELIVGTSTGSVAGGLFRQSRSTATSWWTEASPPTFRSDCSGTGSTADHFCRYFEPVA